MDTPSEIKQYQQNVLEVACYLGYTNVIQALLDHDVSPFENNHKAFKNAIHGTSCKKNLRALLSHPKVEQNLTETEKQHYWAMVAFDSNSDSDSDSSVKSNPSSFS